jgi:hypothetical protein
MITPKYFENYLDLFLHPGWKQFMEEIKEGLENINLEDSKDWNMFLVMKTKKDCFTYVLETENVIKTFYDSQNTPVENDSL